MNGFAVLVAAAALGVDYGWQPDADGQLEYIIQIEPLTLVALRDGQEIVSQLDPYVQNVRRFRIRVGTDMVPRRGTPPREPLADASVNATVQDVQGVQYGWQFIDARQMEFIVQISPDRYVSLRNGEDIVGRIPANLQNLARIRILSGSNTLPRQTLSSVPPTTPGREVPPAKEPTPLTHAPALVAGSRTTNTSPAAPALDPAGPTADPRGLQGTDIDPPTTNNSPAVGTGTGATLYNSQLNPRYQPPADATSGINNRSTLPHVRQPVNTYPGTGAPPAGSSQQIPVTSDPARGVSAPTQLGTVNVNDNRGSSWHSASPNAMDRAPRPLDNTRQMESVGNYRAEQNADYPRLSSSVTLPGRNDSLSVFGSPAGSERSFGAGPYSNTGDSYGLGVPDSLANALGFNPWPNRVVSYEQDVEPVLSSEDFWSSLAATPGDRSLDYDADSEQSKTPGWPLTLAVFTLFASIGGNLFMGWVTMDIYRRSLDLTDDAIDRDGYESPLDRDEEDRWSERRGHHGRSRVRV